MPKKPTELDKTMADLAQLKPSGRGGIRPGQVPRKKGDKAAKTIAREESKAVLREIVLQSLEPLVRAQIHSATGISHFMLRDPETGQFRRLTEVSEIEQALNAEGAQEGSTYWIYTKDPQTPAFTDLMNRAMGKPTEEVQITAPEGITLRWKDSE